ncbi:HAAS signaling domain-containing protein [Rheinheimera oceanensis]|uniref:HAAS signaling domain-containing protein n=1 Tax=Rheinheimera oceanensis TaxID=2817449 RepID=UPI001BFEB8D1|nr:hypothetical protein [Rheinheimera oceanensis]
MELVKRYIAAVQRELPEVKRDEIGRELNANIMDQLDMLSEQQGGLADTDIAAVLKQMGHPREVAQQFVPPQPLISLHYMPVYRYTLFMVLGILFVLQIVGSTSAWLAGDFGLLLYLKSVASGFLKDGCFAFTAITITFALMSVDTAKATTSQNDNWQPQQLPDAGHSWQHISLQDIFTDLATYVFLLIVIWYPLWLSPEQLANSSFLFTDNAHQLLKWASPLALLGIASSLWQLRKRFWSQTMLLGNIVLNGAFVAVILMLAASDPLLKLEPEVWQGVLQLEQLERVAVTGLVITAMFPLWEVVRDILRLRKLA